MKFELSQSFDRPPAVLWKFYATDHIENHPRWDPDMSLEKETDGPIAVGTVIRRHITRGETPVNGTMEVVEFEVERAMGVVINDGPMETHGRAIFEPDGDGGTRVVLEIDMPWLDETEMDPNMIAGLIQRSLDTMKDLVESEY